MLEKTKPRLIITTDSEIDDQCSMIRFLCHANEFEIEGIYSVNSKWQKDGHGEIWMHDLIDVYATVYKNLQQHDPDYPSPDQLHAVTWQGMVDRAPVYAAAPPYRDSAAARQILTKLLDDDPRPLHVAMWGGGTLMAQVLWQLRQEHDAAVVARASAKVKMYFIDYQEIGKGGGQWLRDTFPQAENVLDYQFVGTWNYRPRPDQPYENLMGAAWLAQHVKEGHGPLGAAYRVMKNDEQLYVSEGDTPSFLNLIDNGLRSHERPDFGGWGGRHRRLHDNQWVDAADDGDEKKPMWRWIPAVQNEWAARLDWCVNSYAQANHPPVVRTGAVNDRIVTPGEIVELSAAGTYDPDGDSLSYHWWHYHDVENWPQPITIESADDPEHACFTVPPLAKKDIHIILTVQDDGSPPLTRYRRLIFKIEPN